MEDFGRLVPARTGTRIEVDYELIEDKVVPEITEKTLKEALQTMP